MNVLSVPDHTAVLNGGQHANKNVADRRVATSSVKESTSSSSRSTSFADKRRRLAAAA